MPPAPTDLMAGDLKRLEEPNVRIAARIDGLEASHRDLRQAFASFQGRVDAYLGFMKWLGVFVAGILVAVVAGTGRVVWDASAVNTEMKHQGARLDTMNTDIKQLGTRLDTVSTEVKQQGTRLEMVSTRLDMLSAEMKQQGTRLDMLSAEVKQQGTRLDGVEKRLDGVEKRLDGVEKRLGGVEGRLDGIGKQLEVLIRRAEPKAGG